MPKSETRKNKGAGQEPAPAADVSDPAFEAKLEMDPLDGERPSSAPHGRDRAGQAWPADREAVSMVTRVDKPRPRHRSGGSASGDRSRVVVDRSTLSMPDSPRKREAISAAMGPAEWEAEVSRMKPADVKVVDEPEDPPERRSACWGVCMRVESQDWWHPSYRYDWLCAALVAALGGIVYIAVEPFNREIPGGFDNLGLRYTHKDSTIGSTEVFFSYILVAAFVICVTQYYVRSWHDAHAIVLACASSLAFSVFIYNILIKLAGHHRPNFFDRLDDPNFDPKTYTIEREHWDLHQSWPSGHSFNSMSIFFTLTLYIMGKTRALAPHQGQLWKIFLALLPTMYAWIVGATRTMDYMHTFADVNAGLFFGTFTACLAYFGQFPSLFDVRCHRPRLRRLMDFERYAKAAGTAYSFSQSTSDLNELQAERAPGREV